ncbi:uncharacterized protein LOC128818647 isoform X2 [Vidua macroura]|uniref:uncharacterized protein LOC128818647 isoform X2 n=1 Tax=Vidua macroura TaxID=187451 RepID=UPI0023A8F327|nr:uncharacterized protein LOC128818647 isoform X2 [Vidua macroura]
MAARHDPKAVAKLISFGTTQERKMFPHYFAPDRLGIEVLGVRGSPFLGPGSYLGPQENILKSSMSTRGYVLGARTAPRFQQKAQFHSRTPRSVSRRPFPPVPPPTGPSRRSAAGAGPRPFPSPPAAAASRAALGTRICTPGPARTSSGSPRAGKWRGR